jgi:hypothetical protein
MITPNLFLVSVQAVLDSVIEFFLVFGAFNTPKGVWAFRGYGDDLYLFGTTVYSCMLMAMMYKAATNTHTWTWVNWFFLFGRSVTSAGIASPLSPCLYLSFETRDDQPFRDST